MAKAHYTLASIESWIYEEQEKYIKDKFGEEASINANYGWGVDELKDGVVVSTKVYGCGIVRSEAHYGDTNIVHTFTQVG